MATVIEQAHSRAAARETFRKDQKAARTQATAEFAVAANAFRKNQSAVRFVALMGCMLRLQGISRAETVAELEQFVNTPAAKLAEGYGI